jgi:RNA-binding protein NOB1
MGEIRAFIADANFFIEGTAAIETPHQIFTTQDALAEVRDPRSKARLEHLRTIHDIVTREPTSASYDIVVHSATDSGNLLLLSKTDLALLALALDFMPTDVPETQSAPPSFDEWITVDTFGKPDDFPVILCTSDTTMQCVALLLGIHVISPNGQRIAEVKRWLLRCAACGAETLDASKIFCPECGQHELVRYALVMRNGQQHELPLPKRFEPTTRGKKFAIPTARGKRGQPPALILSEDMMDIARLKYKRTGGARARARDGSSFFDPRRKPRPEPVYGYGGVNPNVPHHRLGKGKKSASR